MTCKQINQWILLNDSGELSATKQDALQQHLSNCSACQAFQALLTDSHQHLAPTEEPPQAVTDQVLRELRKNAPQATSKILIFRKPMLALAASVVILLGLVLTTTHSNKVGMELTLADSQLLEMDDQVISIMYEGLSEDDLAFNFLMAYDG